MAKSDTKIKEVKEDLPPAKLLKMQVAREFFKWWWVFLGLVLGSCFYLHGMHKKKQVYSSLHEKATFLEKELYSAIEKREDLLLSLESQKDPAWTEMLLKKHLGMVPTDQKKVYFEQE